MLEKNCCFKNSKHSDSTFLKTLKSFFDENLL